MINILGTMKMMLHGTILVSYAILGVEDQRQQAPGHPHSEGSTGLSSIGSKASLIC